jgi:hypothetical protein
LLWGEPGCGLFGGVGRGLGSGILRAWFLSLGFWGLGFLSTVSAGLGLGLGLGNLELVDIRKSFLLQLARCQARVDGMSPARGVIPCLCREN